jgi:hypothetical protein
MQAAICAADDPEEFPRIQFTMAVSAKEPSTLGIDEEMVKWWPGNIVDLAGDKPPTLPAEADSSKDSAFAPSSWDKPAASGDHGGSGAERVLPLSLDF